MKVLVTGATGLLGCHITAALLAAGHDVKALVRDPARLDTALAPFDIDASRLQPVVGDLLDQNSVTTALADCEAVVHAAGLFSNDVNQADRMRAINVEASSRLFEAAGRAGIDPIIFISSILALFPPPGDRQRADDPVQQPAGVYARTKADAERTARACQATGMPVVTIYPGAVHGPHDPTFSLGPQMIADFLHNGAVLVTAGGLVYTDVRDIARLVVAALEPGRGPRRYMFGGNYLSHTDLHGLLCRLTGRPLRRQRLPGWLLRGMGRLGDLGTRLLGKQPDLTFEKALVLTASVPCDDAPTIAELGLEPLSAEESFTDLLRWMHASGRLSAAEVGKLAGDS